MWAKASISPLFELAREAGEAEPVGEVDRPHTHRLAVTGDHPRGARHRARRSRYTLVFGRSGADLDHDAVMRIGGEAPGRQAHSLGRRDSHACLGSPPPRIVMGSLA